MNSEKWVFISIDVENDRRLNEMDNNMTLMFGRYVDI